MNNLSLLLTDGMYSFAALLYTPEGKSLIKTVWDETLAEFEPFGAQSILDGMKEG